MRKPFFFSVSSGAQTMSCELETRLTSFFLFCVCLRCLDFVALYRCSGAVRVSFTLQLLSEWARVSS